MRDMNYDGLPEADGWECLRSYVQSRPFMKDDEFINILEMYYPTQDLFEVCSGGEMAQ